MTDIDAKAQEVLDTAAIVKACALIADAMPDLSALIARQQVRYGAEAFHLTLTRTAAMLRTVGGAYQIHLDALKSAVPLSSNPLTHAQTEESQKVRPDPSF